MAQTSLFGNVVLAYKRTLRAGVRRERKKSQVVHRTTWLLIFPGRVPSVECIKAFHEYYISDLEGIQDHYVLAFKDGNNKYAFYRREADAKSVERRKVKQDRKGR